MNINIKGLIVNCLKPKHGKVQYFIGNEMETTKKYEFSPSKLLTLSKETWTKMTTRIRRLNFVGFDAYPP